MTVYRSGVRLEALGASAFVSSMNAAQSAIDSFQKTAGRGVTLDLSRAGAGAASSLERGLSPLQTVVQGALLRVGAIATNTVVGAFQAAGRAASTAFSDALDFGQSVANISALADGGTAAAGAVAQAIGSVAVDPRLIANTESAALAFQQLEKQGLSTSSIIGDEMTGSILRSTVALQNAAGQAGNLTELRTAAEVVGQGMSLFGLEAAEAGALVDTFAGITTNTKFDLTDLNYILANSATAIQGLNLSYTDIGAVALSTGKSFSSARTQATALEAFLLRLSAPTDKAREALQLLGVSAYDSTGNFVGMVSLQDQLQASFTSGQYTAEAFTQLMVEGFGTSGAAMATALAKGEDLTVSMKTLGETSAEAIAAIKTDTTFTALQNLGDVAADLARRLAQPFVDSLAPSIQAASALLSGLAGTFDFLGQRIAASMGPVLTFVTQQFNGLAAAIASLTGASITMPSFGGGAAAPVQGPAARPVTGNSDAAAANRSQSEQARQQGQIGAEQLNAARSIGNGAKALESALAGIEGVFDLSKVTQDDLDLGDAYQEKADEFVRRLNAAAESGGKEFPETIQQARDALERVGIVPSDDLKVLAAQIRTAWADSSLFAAEENISLINEEAIKAAADAKEKAAQGRANLVKAFGSLVDQLVEGTNAGLSGGGGAAATPATPAVTTDPTAFFDPYELYVKPVQEQQAQQAQQAADSQKGLLDGLFTQFDVMGEKFGIVTGLFEGFNKILTGLISSVQGQDFSAAGAALSSTLTTILGALTELTGLADIGTTTANLSTFVQAILNSAADFATGIDGAAVAESAGSLLTTIVGKLGEAVDSVNLTGIAISFTNYVASVGGLLVEAVSGFNFAGVGLSIGTLVSKVGDQLSGALGDPSVGASIQTAADNFASTAIGALQGAFTALNGALASADENNTAGEITTAISGFVTKLIGGFTDAITKADLAATLTEATGMIAKVGGLFNDAIVGFEFESIGVSAGEFIGTAATKITDALSDPAVGENIGAAVGEFVSGLINTVKGAFDLLSGALTGADETFDISSLTTAIDTVVKGFADGFVNSIKQNFTDQETGAVEIPGVTALAENVATLRTQISESIQELLTPEGQQAAIDSISQSAAAINTAITEQVTDLYNSEAVQGALTAAGEKLTEINTKITEQLGYLFSEEGLTTALTTAGEKLTAINTAITEQVTALYNSEAVQGALTAAGEKLTAIGASIGDAINEIANSPEVQTATAALSTALTAITDTVTSFVGRIKGIYDSIASFVPSFASSDETGSTGETQPGFASGAINGIAQSATALAEAITTSFAADAIYTAAVGSGITEAGSGLSADLGAAFAKDVLYPAELAAGFGSITESISGAFTTIYDAIAGFFSGLANILPAWVTGGTSAPAEPEGPEAQKVAEQTKEILVESQKTLNLANQVGNSGQIAPIFDFGDIASGRYEPTANADGSLTEAGQEKALATAGALLSGLTGALGKAFTPAVAEVSTQLASTLSTVQSASTAALEASRSAATIGPAGGEQPVELSESAVIAIGTYAAAQAQAASQGQDTAATLTPEQILGETVNQLPTIFYQAAQEAVVGLASSSLVGATVDPSAAGLGGEYGPPLVQATENLVTAATTLAAPVAAEGANALGDREILTEYGPDSQKLIEKQTDALIKNTTATAYGPQEQENSFVSPEAQQLLTGLTTSIPAAGGAFNVSLGNATTSANDFIGPMDEATAATVRLGEATDDQITAGDKLAGSFNTLLDKSDKTATNLSTLNDALSNQSIGQGLDDFVSALEDTINGMNKALDKLGTEAPAPTDTTQPDTGSGPFAAGTRSYPGGRGLGGEEGPELFITPDGRAGMLGQGGPELFTAPVGTVIYPADVTRSILSRGARGLGGGIFAAADGAGTFNSTLFGDLPSLPPITIPQGPDSEVTTDEPVATTNTGVDLSLFSKFLQSLGQSDPSGLVARASQLAQQVGNASSDAAKGTARQIADLFTKGLFGGRRDAPQTQVINVNVNNSQDYSTNNYNYNYGGLQMKTMQSTESLARNFRLLQAVAG